MPSTCLSLQFQRLLDGRPGSDPLIPRPARRSLLLPLPTFRIVAQQGRHNRKPRHEHQIRIRHLVTNQVLLASFLEVSLNDADHTLDLVAVAVFHAHKVFL